FPGSPSGGLRLSLRVGAGQWHGAQISSMHNLVEKFQEYSTWRFTLRRAIEQYRGWLRDSHLGDALADSRIARVLSRLDDDKLTIAFVAEFSRGKSELINSIFFAD